ncbi:hypothetical protein J3R30DRAFT_3538155 [Lentinula aciculospora]|uniref:DUF6533 domain-containing protein n=1 Tax=Lentinula aciculospora TaxID=153920 RepID=A0A9W8ZYE2_9AGAR|nr:hypothetical protein J3R30DRAFT_3538155 [Lentinula aciculospora]
MDTASGRISQDFTWASIALLYYDYGTTLDEEVEYIWGMRFSSSTLLYILCHYAMLANLLYPLAHLNKLGLSCDIWYKIIAVLGVLGRAAVMVTFTLRTYVVWSQSRIVLVSLIMLGVATVLTDAIFVPRQSCENTKGNTATVDIVRSLLTIVFETLSATLIFIRSFQAYKSGGLYSSEHGFTYILMQEGAVYFCVVSLFTVATFVLKLCTKSQYLHDLLNAFTLPLSGLLTARFLLHLRAWNKTRCTTVSCATALDIDSQNDSHVSSISSTGIQLGSATASNNSETHWMSTTEFGEDPMLETKRTFLS